MLCEAPRGFKTIYIYTKTRFRKLEMFDLQNFESLPLNFIVEHHFACLPPQTILTVGQRCRRCGVRWGFFRRKIGWVLWAGSGSCLSVLVLQLTLRENDFEVKFRSRCKRVQWKRAGFLNSLTSMTSPWTSMIPQMTQCWMIRGFKSPTSISSWKACFYIKLFQFWLLVSTGRKFGRIQNRIRVH